MKAYCDSSVILRVVFAEKGALAEWKKIRDGATSTVAHTECLRTIDRLRLRATLTDAMVAERRQRIEKVFARLTLIPVSPPVLRRAGEPFPTTLGTLDAIHLSSALLWRQFHAANAVLATHDSELATASRAVGLAVIG